MDAFPTFENAIAELGQVDAGRALAKSQIQHWRSEYAQLNRRRKQLVRAIDRMSKRMLRVVEKITPDGEAQHVAAEASIIHEIENELNARGVMERIIADRFRTESSRAYGGRRWTHLKPGTVKARIRAGYGAGPMLQNEGTLLANAQTAVADTFKFNYDEIEWPDIEEIGLDYAAAQNYGTEYIPARPFFLKPSQREMKWIYDLARRMLANKMHGRMTNPEEVLAIGVQRGSSVTEVSGGGVY